MNKYIIKNCPAYCDNTRLCRGAYNREIEYQYCSGNGEENCLLKRIVSLCKENQFYGYGAIMLENGLSTDILNFLEIEEVNYDR